MRAKRIICAFLVIVMLFTFGGGLAFAGNGKTKLSKLSDEQLLSVLLENGLEIPKECDVPENTIQRIRRTIDLIDNDQDLSYAAGWVPGYELHMSVISAAERYYGIKMGFGDSSPKAYYYTLQDSTYYGYGSTNQNCYGYSLSVSNLYKDPGFYAYGGNIPDSMMPSITAYQLANRVKSDLQTTTFNKGCIKITTTRPSYMSGRSAICVRKGKLDSVNEYDYHFMRVFSSNIWRHKPGNTHILTYNSLPQSSVNWTNEYATSSYSFHPGYITYTGTIYYYMLTTMIT